MVVLTEIITGMKNMAKAINNNFKAINNETVTRSNTTTTAFPSFGGTFTAIDSISTDTKGRITSVRTKTVTIPNTNVQTVRKDFILNGQTGYIVQSKLLNWVHLYIYWANGSTTYTTSSGTVLFAVDTAFVPNSSRIFKDTAVGSSGDTLPFNINAGEQGIRATSNFSIPPNRTIAMQVIYTV